MTASVNIQSEKASILLIYTGGTIGMIENPETGVLESFNFQHLKDNMPELKKLGYAVSTIQFDPAMDSSEMGPESWMKIVKIIADNYQLYDGFVVLHGTDTMSFTASALSFMLENLSKPVHLYRFAIADRYVADRRERKPDHRHRDRRSQGKRCPGCAGGLYLFRK